MVLRIERLEGEEDIEEDIIVLRASGRIDAEHVEMIRDLLGREKRRVAIDLKEVVLVAREAVDLLAVSEADGIELRNCNPYIRGCVDRARKNRGINRRGPQNQK